jgi:hypothetical protein
MKCYGTAFFCSESIIPPRIGRPDRSYVPAVDRRIHQSTSRNNSHEVSHYIAGLIKTIFLQIKPEHTLPKYWGNYTRKGDIAPGPNDRFFKPSGATIQIIPETSSVPMELIIENIQPPNDTKALAEYIRRELRDILGAAGQFKDLAKTINQVLKKEKTLLTKYIENSREILRDLVSIFGKFNVASPIHEAFKKYSREDKESLKSVLRVTKRLLKSGTGIKEEEIPSFFQELFRRFPDLENALLETVHGMEPEVISYGDHGESKQGSPIVEALQHFLDTGEKTEIYTAIDSFVSADNCFKKSLEELIEIFKETIFVYDEAIHNNPDEKGLVGQLQLNPNKYGVGKRTYQMYKDRPIPSGALIGIINQTFSKIFPQDPKADFLFDNAQRKIPSELISTPEDSYESAVKKGDEIERLSRQTTPIKNRIIALQKEIRTLLNQNNEEATTLITQKQKQINNLMSQLEVSYFLCEVSFPT